MNFFKKIAVGAAVTVVALGTAAQQPLSGAGVVSTAPGKFAAGEVVTVSAVVTEIDVQKRVVTLKGAQGNTFRVVAGPEVRNFAQVKVGDELLVAHAEALSLELKKGAAGFRERLDRDTTAPAAPGAKPGVVQVHEVIITANVIAVNQRAQTVTLRGPKEVVDLRVKDPEQLKLIQVGDQVVARYTDAVAISMQPKPAR